jgi:hypothetical protein
MVRAKINTGSVDASAAISEPPGKPRHHDE